MTETANRFVPDEAKFAELMLYIAKKCEGDPTFGAIKLNKLLWISDFTAYAKYGKPVSGVEYQKLAQGPAPRPLMPIRERMVQVERSAAIQESMVGAYKQHRLIALREPDLSAFTGKEIALIDAVIDRWRGVSATDISDASHGFLGWKAARDGETIPYSTVFVVARPLTDAENAYAMTIEPECRG
ncbi:MAG: SocA family protein [Acidobacteria bacterium]|nr:SocA family protein [Acidobacteriota bacterium]